MSLFIGRTRLQGLVSVVDQFAFSGTNFLTAVIIGRFAGAAELGLYSLAFSIIMLAIGFQRSLFISPFVVVYGRLDDYEMASMRGTLFMSTLAFGAVLAVLALLITPAKSPEMAIALAIALPAGLLRDFGRRLSIAEMNVGTALFLDLSIAICQLAAVILLLWNGSLTAITALVACSCVWVGVGVAGWFHSRHRYRFDSERHSANLMELWPIGRWISLSQLISTAQSFALPWVMAVMHSIELAGIYAACWTILQVASPAIEGLGNLLGPALAKSALRNEHGSLRRQVRSATVVFAMLMGLLVVAVALFGNAALRFLYGPAFAEYYQVLLVMTVAVAAGNLSIPASKALTQIGCAHCNFWITLVGLLLTVGLAFPFLFWFGASGAAWGLAVGSLVVYVSRWSFYRQNMVQFEDRYAMPVDSGLAESRVPGSIGERLT